MTGLDRELAQAQRPFADPLRRLQTIPGVGPIVAATALAVFSDITRFPDAKHAASYAGIVPATYQSGDRAAHGRITKRGAAELRLRDPGELRAPLVRRNIVLLWQGWHMTLTRWLRTYLFVPVSRQIMRCGGGRFDVAAIAIAQLVTMIFCGLWHGITWGFALWGAAQAAELVWVGLSARRVGRMLPDAWLRFWRRHPLGAACSIALTFNAFSFSNVLVYSTLAQALRIYGRLVGVAG